jgi:uncharacterized BrkB/YihY/UPF0761 family membrane protein
VDYSNNIMTLFTLTWFIVGAVSSIIIYGLVEVFGDEKFGSPFRVFVTGTLSGFLTFIALLATIFIIAVVSFDIFIKSKSENSKIIKRK